ncbi:hemin ABC transporter substrate-binding protein [Vibrio ostreicida]|nr:hemin ABC transporter substrate-binding protein [Vibrio ostreicida]
MLNRIITYTFTTLSCFALMGNAMASERIISAGSAVTELIVALGQQDKLIAVDITSTLPPGLKLPPVGYHKQLSAEGLLTLNPTQLIGSDEMGPITTLNQLKQSGVAVNIVDTSPTAEGLLNRIDEIAALTDSNDNAAALKAEVSQRIAQLEQIAIKQPVSQKILFLLINEGRPANVAGANTTPNAIIELAGGTNPAATKIESYKPLSTESMLEMQPDIILVSGRSYKTLGGPDAILAKMPLLAATPAGQSKQIIQIDGRALIGGLGLKSLAEAQRLSQIIHPSE